jgi:hypothetical protein
MVGLVPALTLNPNLAFLPGLTGGARSSGLTPPAGYVFLVDMDGAYLTDADGAYLVEPM